MAYESVVWTSKTPMTWDKFAQMQQNIDELKSVIDGTVAYIPGTPRGIGKGIVHLQQIENTITIPNGATFAQIGQAFTPLTESGRLYLFECFIPAFHSWSGVGVVRLLQNDTVLQYAIIGMANDARVSYIHQLDQSDYAGTGHIGIHISPGTSTTAIYKVDAVPLFSGHTPGGIITAAGDIKPYVKFTDVGPAI